MAFWFAGSASSVTPEGSVVTSGAEPSGRTPPSAAITIVSLVPGRRGSAREEAPASASPSATGRRGRRGRPRRFADPFLLLGTGGEGEEEEEHPSHRAPTFLLALTRVTVVRFRSMKYPLAKSWRSRGCRPASAANSLFR